MEKLQKEGRVDARVKGLVRQKAELRVKERTYQVCTELRGQACAAFQANRDPPTQAVVPLSVGATSPSKD